jgi:Predicted membrane protein (DUF2306)
MQPNAATRLAVMQPATRLERTTIPLRGLRGWALMCVLLAVPVCVTALGAGMGLIALPYELALVDQRLPVVFRLHMLASGPALVLIACAIAAHGRSLHKLLGRSAALLVVAGGITAMPVAIASEASSAARAGFLLQALVWIALVVLAVAAVRRGDRTRHMWLMLGVAAVASGAIWLRLASWAAVKVDLPFDTAYALAAWLSWLLPLGMVHLIHRHKTAAPRTRYFPSLARALTRTLSSG